MTALLVAAPSTVAPNGTYTVTISGAADLRSRLLINGTALPTICSPTDPQSVSVTAGSAGSESVTFEQYVAGAWTSAATGITVTVAAPPAGTGSYPADRAFGFLATTLASVPTAPTYLGTITDPTYGMLYTRWTNANQDRHAYSRCGPGGWSKDGDRALLNFGTVTSHIISMVDGSNVSSGGGYLAMACWDPLDNNKLYGVAGNAFKSQNATTKSITTLHTFGAYTTVSLGEYEGGISDDGKYVALIGDSTNLIVYRIDTDTVIATLSVGSTISDCQISPSGAYVTLTVSGGKRRYLQNLTGSLTLNANTNHADSAVNALGEDVLVCNNPSTGKVTAYRLSDGAATLLFGSTSTAFEYGHVGRARLRPGWIYLSVYDTSTMAGRRGNDQIVAVKLDGSMTVEDFGYAYNRTNGSTYANQPHACPSPDGTRVLFASPWGNGSGNTYAYTVEMPA